MCLFLKTQPPICTYNLENVPKHVPENVLIHDNLMTVLFSLDLIKTVDAPASIHSASLHPEKDFFVAGGDDFKLYKYDYGTKEEMGRNIV